MRKVLISCAMLAGACTGQEEVEAPVAPPTTETPSDLIVVGAGEDVEATTTTAEVTTTTAPTTTTTEPPATTTTAAPLPILCAWMPHPAHHEECPEEPAEYLQPVATTAPVQATSSGWSIPTYIVMCESGGDWDAYNASGASGPYQLMPMHFGGELAMNQSRAAQHAKAAELWAGGAGKSHWAACL